VTSDDRSPVELAAAAYEAVRSLNHATFPAQCELADQQELYCVLGSLAALLRATPQALRQVGDWVAGEQLRGRVGVDDACPASPATTVDAIVTALSTAREAVARAGREADHAHEAAAHLIIDPFSQIGM
jgi:hypothetical protein